MENAKCIFCNLCGHKINLRYKFISAKVLSRNKYIGKLNAFALAFVSVVTKLIDFAVTATVIENIC